MNSFEDNAKKFKKAVLRNEDRETNAKYASKYPHEIKKNFPDSSQKSKLDMTHNYFTKHMQSDK